MPEIVAIDLGGTHARFAIASQKNRSARPILGEVITLSTGDYPSLADAWRDFEHKAEKSLPRCAAIAAAGPVHDGRIEMTNQPWDIDRQSIASAVGLDHVFLINDLEAIAQAAAHAHNDELADISGSPEPLPADGLISIVGIGTGLGTAMLIRKAGSVETRAAEGGHIGFAPVDDFEIKLLGQLQNQFGRVSAERVASGPGIVAIHELIGGKPGASDQELWRKAMSGSDADAEEAARHVCRSLGSFAGDLVLAHGANAVILTGGLGRRLEGLLPGSGFIERFRAKGRFADDMARIPVKLLKMDQPGLLGAAIAFFSSEACL
ncbi:MAG TPA: ROK family protein [Sphingomicrobium sp.]|nr:ROK family protein [Sphingomicrobium sp.]